MKEKEIKELVEKGWLRLRVIFEVIGNPKEHVIESIKLYMDNIKKEERLKMLNEDFAEPEELEEGKLWSTHCEAEILAEDLEVVTWLCVSFTPASVEIIEPEEFLVQNKDLGVWLNELLIRLHEIGISYKNVLSENELLKKNINALIRNSILLALEKPKTASEISKTVGIDDPTLLEPFFIAMKKEKRIEQQGETYTKL